MGLMHVAPVKRRRNGSYADPAESHRQTTVYYTVPDGKGDHKQVCRSTFANIFNLSHKRIQHLTEKKKTGCTTYTDNRGKNKGAQKYTEQDKEMIINHINSFPKEASHYSRHKTSKQYLSPDLNINRLYRCFISTYPDVKINYRFYSTVFHQNFPKLKFGPPRSDTCTTCDLLNIQIKAVNQSGMETAKTKLALHHRKSEKAMGMMKTDIQNSQEPASLECTIAMDLQQVLFIPTLTHGDMFYLRQLSCYNLGIHVGDTSTAFMCLWHEGITGRGGNEISSCIWKVLKSKITTKKILNIWSDNCIGQNKNKMVLLTLMLLVKDGIFEEINHKFLVKGHTYLACDRDFALIEKRKRVTKAYLPSDLEEMIKTTRHDNPFNVVTMCNEDFLDLKTAADKFLNTTKLNISKASWIKITKNKPTTVYIRKTFNDMEEWTEVDVLKKGKKKDFSNISLSKLECKSTISEDKKENLKTMISFLEDENHKQFYQTLIEKNA